MLVTLPERFPFQLPIYKYFEYKDQLLMQVIFQSDEMVDDHEQVPLHGV